MRRSSSDDELRVMPWWLVLLGLVVAAGLGWLVLVWLLGEADGGDTRAQLRIDAIRTGLTVVAGTGGAVALLFAARRQWVNERSQRHREQVAVAEREHRERVQAHAESVAEVAQRHQEDRSRSADHDALQRRITDLYAKAVDQLGSDRPAVRMGGLYALERLGQDNGQHRQTIVDVLCAYLRMPEAGDDPREAQVRGAAQRLLARHLRPADVEVHWPGMRLDLAGARLVDFDVSRCTIEALDLAGAVFTGIARFVGTVVPARLVLSGARFEHVEFDQACLLSDLVAADVTCSGPVSFTDAAFGGTVSFDRAAFDGPVSFASATFRQPASFDRARFGEGARFTGAVFERGVSVEHATFAGRASFRGVRFRDMAMFRFTVFAGDACYTDAVFGEDAHFGRVEFGGCATFDGATARRSALFDRTRASAAMPHSWPPGYGTRPEDGSWLLVTADDPA